jgi:ring-1,2-phenylacetyl-CoA epoxidase subunit PaaC
MQKVSSTNIENANLVSQSAGQLINYLQHLGDNSLILSQRNSEWCGHGPILEQDIAITNISLDLIGQARNFYQYAANLINVANSEEQLGYLDNEATPNSKSQIPNSSNKVTEDTLAYHRDVREFRNCLLAELPNGDWAHTILRQFFFSNYQFHLFTELINSRDEQLAAIAVKSLKEVTYHLRWSSEWVIRLGDGTEESRKRILSALEELWPFTGELFMPADYEMSLEKEGIGIDPSTLRSVWDNKLKSVFDEANIPVPGDAWYQSGGKDGKHSEHLGFILTELQFMQRAYPGNEW